MFHKGTNVQVIVLALHLVPTMGIRAEPTCCIHNTSNVCLLYPGGCALYARYHARDGGLSQLLFQHPRATVCNLQNIDQMAPLQWGRRVIKGIILRLLLTSQSCYEL